MSEDNEKHLASLEIVQRHDSITQFNRITNSAKPHNQGILRFFYQMKLLLWKRYVESTKTKTDVLKVVLPPLLFFALMLLIYNVFPFFDGGGIEYFFVPLGFWIYIQRLVVQVMFEKGSRLQESMRMMGLLDSAYWLSYFISDGIILGFVLSFLCSIMSTGGLFNDGNFGAILGLLFVFCLSSVTFGFFLTSFSDSAQFGTQFTLCVLMGMYVVFIIVFLAGKNTIPLKSCQIIASFFPPLALQVGCQTFLKSYDGIPLSSVCGILFADIFIYALLAWYFTQVWPSSIGVRKPFYFFLLPNYWFPSRNAASDNCLAERRIAAEEGLLDSIPVEEANEALLGPPTIVVQNLRKTFGSTSVVNDLKFKMYENQIFALLGHNGAGKTTTINILTGLISPDFATESSHAFVYGKNIAKEMDNIRLSLGICPQHDVLFEKLSVREHILFFSQLKGNSYSEADQEAVALTKLFHLGERLEHLGSELSGGQKRKLSVAIAVCGGSKFVVLDEPTAGMDPLARRELWDLLASLRHGRSMLLTTHYMDEADILGDRIGIMSLGKMQCCGSSQFLKTSLGAGYRLIFDKSAGMDNVQIAALTGYVQRYIPEATYSTEVGQNTVVTYTLPFSTVDKFGSFFTALEKDLNKLAVTGFNLTITTLEDVFLKVGEDHTVTPHADANAIGIGSERTYNTNFVSQVIGIVFRRLFYASHDFLTLVLLILPLAAIILSAILYEKNIISSNLQLSDLACTGITIAGYIGAPGMIAEFLVRERSDKLRNVLNVMGCSYGAYWVGSFIADYILMTITLGVMFISWGGAGISDFYASQGGLNFFLWILFIFEMISFAYACSFMFTSPKSCIWTMPVLVIVLLIMPNVILLIGLEIARGVGTSVSSSTQAGVLLWGIVFLSPYGAIFCAALNVVNDYSSLVTNLPDVGACIAIMIIESAIFLSFAYYTDVQASVSLSATFDPTTDEAALELLDPDVKEERNRTLNDKDGATADAPLVIKRLRKFFPPKVAGRRGVMAVEDLALRVDKGEIFGLLGANGAGKTTALSMLTRLLVPTSGDAFLAGHSILSDFTRGATHLGVVTQNNSLWDKLSVEDHLYLFARLRGVPEDLVKRVVTGTIDQLELTPHRTKLAMNLSGGMKRKLCVAIALIGDPEVVLLDEPSAGLDPVSRRNLWTVILRTMSNRSVILTTHSMEEAEALCRRIGIMVQGQVRALGTKLHLKNKFGSGFELTVKLQANDINKEISDLTKFVNQMFPSAFVLADNGGLITYQIPKEEMKMSVAFKGLHEQKAALSIEEFTIAQPTLEQVFIRIVHKHTPEENITPNVVGADEVVQEVNKCGCTDNFTKLFTIVTTILFIVFWAIGIAVFGRHNQKGSSAFIILGIVWLITACVGCNLLFCACCRPPKGADDN